MEPERTPGVVPVHHQIADSLREQIASGTLKPGQSLPTIRELAQRWKCADGPVRRALEVLRTEGLITAGRGRPATVRNRQKRTPITLTTSWTQEQKDLVLRPRAERAKVGGIELTAGISIQDTVSSHRYSTITADPDLAAEFDVDAGTELVRRAYEITDPETGHLLSWSISYIPRCLIEGNPALLDDSNEPWPGGHQHQLYTVGIEIAEFRRTVIAVEPTPAERQRWGIDTGVPILAVRSRSVATNGKVVEVSDARYPADRTEIALVEMLEPWPDDHPEYDEAKDV
ncbi:MAG: GntR family transcriptional regulator [Propionibacteriales bacterium]|nr:GntR family transcriptional regulator [Propionibacteriales bacterium]